MDNIEWFKSLQDMRSKYNVIVLPSPTDNIPTLNKPNVNVSTLARQGGIDRNHNHNKKKKNSQEPGRGGKRGLDFYVNVFNTEPPTKRVRLNIEFE